MNLVTSRNFFLLFLVANLFILEALATSEDQEAEKEVQEEPRSRGRNRLSNRRAQRQRISRRRSRTKEVEVEEEEEEPKVEDKGKPIESVKPPEYKPEPGKESKPGPILADNIGIKSDSKPIRFNDYPVKATNFFPWRIHRFLNPFPIDLHLIQPSPDTAKGV